MLKDHTPDRMLKISEVAEMLNVHPNTLRRWSNRGIIESYRLGPRGDHRFSVSEVARFIGGFSGFKDDGPEPQGE